MAKKLKSKVDDAAGHTARGQDSAQPGGPATGGEGSRTTDALTLWDADTGGPTMPPLRLARLDANLRLFVPFTTAVGRVRVHYLDYPSLTGYTRCNGTDCVVCRVGRHGEDRDLWPVYDVLDRAVVVVAVIPDRSAVYVAAPVTSGRRFADWFPQRGRVEAGTPAYEAEHRRHVIDPNCAAAAAQVAGLRERLTGVVIDPTAVTYDGWEQADYHALWVTVIERYAGTVVFLDGWEYSAGCTYEFLTALRTGATTLTADLTPFRPAVGVAAVRAAVTEMRDRGVPAGFIETVLDALSAYERYPGHDDVRLAL